MNTTKKTAGKTATKVIDYSSNLDVVISKYVLNKDKISQLKKFSNDELKDLKFKVGKYGSFKVDKLDREFLKGAKSMMIDVYYNVKKSVVYHGALIKVNQPNMPESKTLIL
ncbi:MAG: hypothetical protein QM734_16335 [Cyclobacteriaceae bacterium]